MFPQIPSKKVKSEVMVYTGDAHNRSYMFFDDANLLLSDLRDSEISYEVFTDSFNTVANEFIIAVTGEGIKNRKRQKRSISYFRDENQINVEELRKKNINSKLQRLDITHSQINGRILLDYIFKVNCYERYHNCTSYFPNLFYLL